MLITDETDKLLMIPGPTPVLREILAALAEPPLSHMGAPMAAIISAALDGIMSIAGSESGQPFAFAGSGTLAQEAAVINLVAPGERLLVASNGIFGDRFVPLAQAHGIEVDHWAVPWGQSVTADGLRERLGRTPARAVTITQVETSTGVQAPVAELAAVAREFGAFVIVDAVCSLAGLPVDMDKNGIDIVLSGAQKALGVPPGLAILVASPRALERRRTMGRIQSYYADLLNWLPSMEQPATYFSTHAVNLFYALRAGVEIIAREGLSARFARHERLAAAFRAGMAALGFHPFADQRWLAPTLSVLAYPEGVNDEPFRNGLAERGIICAACLGDFKGRGARFGHMGNITATEILQTVHAVEATVLALGSGIHAGTGVEAAGTVLSSPERVVVAAR